MTQHRAPDDWMWNTVLAVAGTAALIFGLCCCGAGFLIGARLV